MPSATALAGRIAKVLRTAQASPRVVKIRTVSTVGGDDLLRVGYATEVVDIVVDPPPVVRQVKAHEVQMSGGLVQPGDWALLFGTGVTEEQLRAGQILYGDDVFQVVRVDPVVFGGAAVAFKVQARTRQIAETT